MHTGARLCVLLVFLAIGIFPGFAESGNITTYVGPGLPQDGTRATNQTIGAPQGLSAGPSGSFFFSYPAEGRVYRVYADGTLRLIAGTSPGYSGDSGLATQAQLNRPMGIASDYAGNLYIADSSNHRIRKVTIDGFISTVAGDGTQGFSGDGDFAASAQLSNPTGVFVDGSGNLYIADTGNNRIRMVASNRTISTVAGDGTAGFGGDGAAATLAQLNAPAGVTMDGSGNLYILDLNRIRKVTPNGVISTIAGNGTAGFSGDGGPALEAQLNSPTAVAVDASGNVYIADHGNDRIRQVTSGGTIQTFAGRGPGFSGDGFFAMFAQLFRPTGVAVSTAGNVYISDTGNGRIRKVGSDNIINTVAGNGNGDGGPAASAQMGYVSGVALDSSGNLYVADFDFNRIRKVTRKGVISTVAGSGAYGFSGDGGPATAARLAAPYQMVVDSEGNLYFADSDNNRIRKVTPAGLISTVAGTGTAGLSGNGGPAIEAELNHPLGVALDSAGVLYIADTGNHCVRKVTSDGLITMIAGNSTAGFSGDGGFALNAQMGFPHGIALDSSGNLYIADFGNNRVRKVTPQGIISTVAGNGSAGLIGDRGPALLAQVSHPFAVAVDPIDNVFIAEYDGHRIRKLLSNGTITTIAGMGTPGFSGDGGPANVSQLNTLTGLVIDSSANFYIADALNSRVRKISGMGTCLVHVNAQGAAKCQTAGGTGTIRVGYAKLGVSNSGINPYPYGTAVFSLDQDGMRISEAGVPASPPTFHARVFIDYRKAVNAVPGRIDLQTVDINTGIAIVNTGADQANLTFTLRAANGTALADGHGSLEAGGQIACFIDQLKDKLAPDFNFPTNFSRGVSFGSLDISSDQLVSVLALRGTKNQRGDFLITTTPVADLQSPGSTNPIYFSQMADGGGWTTSLMLMNTTDAIETGEILISDADGNPLAVDPAVGTAASSFTYTIYPHGIYQLQTDGSPADLRSGWIQVTPDDGNLTPVGTGLFGFTPSDTLVSESGIPAAGATKHARIYVDLSDGHNTGLAISNVSATENLITVTAFKADGVTEAGVSLGPIHLNAKGYTAKFADQFIAGLPEGFTGVLDISSDTDFSALTLRSLMNGRNDFLMTTFPVADLNKAAPAPVVFPHMADREGYVTDFILMGSGQPADATLNYFDESGTPTDFSE